MLNDPAEIQKRINIGGIKLSPELAQFSCSRRKTDPCFLVPLLQTIAQHKVNIVYFSLSDSPDEVNLTFCVEAVHRATVHATLGNSIVRVEQLQHQDSAGTVTLFPHKNSLNLLGRVFATCGSRSLAISGLLTSISALSFLTPYSFLDDTVAALTTMLELPENHAPFRPQSVLVNMVETVAVYWEPIIRVYGFDVRKDVSLVEITFRAENTQALGHTLLELREQDMGFIMVLLETTGDGNLRLCLVLKPEIAEKCRDHLENSVQKGYTLAVKVIEPVEVLFFHGPHFQDRYGIVEALFRSLDQQQIALHLVGCTGTSVYLVVGAGEAERAREMLSRDFVVP